MTVERLRGGTKKGVYRLTLADATTRIAYVWNAAEDYWPADQDHGDPFGHASGPDLFARAHATLTGIGVRVPKLIHQHGAVALVEDIRGGNIETHRPAPVLARLNATINTMHHHRGDRYGRPGATREGRCEDLVLHRALDHLTRSAARVDRIAAVRQRIADLLHARHAAVAPRREYGLIHGELGPDHVLVDNDEPVLIDIEGIMFFDVEWEHVFLELRFADDYRHLRADGLDDDRMAFYRLALHLSLVAGPLRLLDGDFPARAAMLDIVEHNIARTLAECSV